MRRALPVTAVFAAVVFMAVVVGGGTAQATQSLGQATAIQAPADAAADPNAVLNAIACPAAGECVAVGQYVDGKGIKQAMVVDQADGTWHQAVTIDSPAEPKTGASLVRGVNVAGVDPTPARKTFTIG
jgi:hypothetical protein